MKRIEKMKNLFTYTLLVKTLATLVLSLVINQYSSSTQSIWLPVAAIFIVQTTQGTIFKQMMQMYLFILLVIVALSILHLLTPNHFYFIAILLFVLANYFLPKIRARENLTFYYAFIVLVLATLLSSQTPSYTLIYNRLYDVTLGGLCALFMSLMLFWFSRENKFLFNMSQTLNGYGEMNLTITTQFVTADIPIMHSFLQQKRHLEALMPTWVFEGGYDVKLKQSHQFFLAKVQQVSQIIAVLQHLTRMSISEELRQQFSAEIIACGKLISEEFNTLSISLASQEILVVKALSNEINQLELFFQKSINVPAELLDISNDYLYMAAFIQQLKYLQAILGDLGKSVR